MKLADRAQTVYEGVIDNDCRTPLVGGCNRRELPPFVRCPGKSC